MKIFRVLAFIFLLTLLSACLYPDELRNQNMPTNDEQLEQMQRAVETFQEQQNGLLPILTRDHDTDVFIRYPIDFNRLKEMNMIGETPKNAYEQGGYYTYVIIHPEDDPLVKVVDVRLTQALQQINYEINLYQQKNFYPPFKDVLFQNYFTIDESKLNSKEKLTVTSPYTQNDLEVFLDQNGDALVDYRPDVYQLMQEHDIENYDGDLRYLLTEHYPFVPVYSPPMYFEDGHIIFISEEA